MWYNKQQRNTNSGFPYVGESMKVTFKLDHPSLQVTFYWYSMGCISGVFYVIYTCYYNIGRLKKYLFGIFCFRRYTQQIWFWESYCIDSIVSDGTLVVWYMELF